MHQLSPLTLESETTPDLIDAHLEIIRLSDELETKTRSMYQFQEFLRVIAQSLDSEKVYSDVLSKFSDIMKSECSSLMVLHEESDELALEAAVGASFEESNKIRMKMGDGISGSVLATACLCLCAMWIPTDGSGINVMGIIKPNLLSVIPSP